MRAGAINSAKLAGEKSSAKCLPPDGGGGKFDLEFVSGPGRGSEAGAGVVLADADRLQNLDGFARDILAFAPGFLNQQKIRQGIAIQDGRFRAIQTHGKVIDARAGNRRHQMLNHADADTVFFQHRAQPRFTHQVIARGNRPAAQIAAHEQHPLSRGRRRQGHGHADPGMQGNAGGCDRASDGLAGDHVRLYKQKRAADAALSHDWLYVARQLD